MYESRSWQGVLDRTLCDKVCQSLQGLNNPLARRPGLVISTFGLGEIISCMPDGLVKKYIGYCSVANHFFQTLAKMASGLKQVLAKMK